MEENDIETIMADLFCEEIIPIVQNESVAKPESPPKRAKAKKKQKRHKSVDSDEDFQEIESEPKRRRSARIPPKVKKNNNLYSEENDSENESVLVEDKDDSKDSSFVPEVKAKILKASDEIKVKKKKESDSRGYDFESIGTRNIQPDFFMPGDILLYVGIKRPDGPIIGAKSKSIECLGRNEKLIAELRVVECETEHKTKMKKYTTLCTTIGMYGTRKSASSAKTGHEFLHRYEEDSDIFTTVLKVVSNQCKKKEQDVSVGYDNLMNQQRFLESVMQDYSRNDRIVKLTDCSLYKRFLKNNHTRISESPQSSQSSGQDVIDLTVEIDDDDDNENSNTSNENVSIPPAKTESVEKPKNEMEEKLHSIQNTEVIKFFEKDEKLEKHLRQYVQDGDKHERHRLVFKNKQYSLYSELSSMANIMFLKNENNIDAKLSIIAKDRFVTKLLPELDDFSADRYAKNVIVPEGIEFYLQIKFNLSKEEAHKAFVNHRAKSDEDDEDELCENNDNEIVTYPPNAESDEACFEDLIPDID